MMKKQERFGTNGKGSYEVIISGSFNEDEDYKIHGEVYLDGYGFCNVRIWEGIHVIEIGDPENHRIVWRLPVEGFLEAMQKAVSGSLPDLTDLPE